MTDSLEEQVGESLGSSLTIERELGGGGMSRVFLASDSKLGRRVVVKVLSPELAAGVNVDRFSREIKFAASLQHPNIVPVLTTGQTADDLPWYTMPFVAGQSLRQRMESGPVPVRESIRILSDVGRALAAAHADGIVHRDVKPENVLLSKGVAVVTDFGIAKALADSRLATPTLTDVGTSLGTPRYIAPEQAVGGAVDARADVYAWGVVAYELLSGRHPFSAATTSQQLVAAHLSTPAPSLCEACPQIPKRVCELVADCLEKDPSRRPATAEVIVERLEGIQLSEPGRTTRWRNPALVATAMLVLVAAITARLRSSSREPTAARVAPTLSRVAIARFEKAGDAGSSVALGSMAADWILQGLSNTELVEAQLLGDASSNAPPRLQAQRANATVYVTGSYYTIADSVQFQARIADVASGNILAVTEPSRGSLRDPTKALDLLRQRVFLALAGQTDPRLRPYIKQSMQPPSLESYQAYVRGMEAFTASRWQEAAQELETAYRRDTTFVRAWVMCAVAHTNLREWTAADSIAHTLLRRVASVGPADRYFVRWLAADIDGPRVDALEALRKSDALVPGTLWSFQHAWEANQLNRPREALAALQRVDTAGEARSFSNYWFQLTMAYHLLGDYDAELRAAKMARRAVPSTPSPLGYEARALIAAGKLDEARKIVDSVSAQLTRDPETPVRLLGDIATWAAWHGHPELSREIAERSVRIAANHSSPDQKTVAHRAALARALYVSGRWTDSKQLFENLIRTDSARLSYRGQLGVLAARMGDRDLAQQIADSLGRLTGRYLFADPLRWRARIAAQVGNSEDALHLLDQESAVGSGGSTLLPFGDFDLIPLQGYAPFKALITPKG